MGINTQGMCTSFKRDVLQGLHAFGPSVIRAATTADTFNAALYLANQGINNATTSYTQNTASFTGTQTGTSLNVSAVAYGTIVVGMLIVGTGITAGTYISALGTGTGGTGTYTTSVTGTATGAAITSTGELSGTNYTAGGVAITNATAPAMTNATITTSSISGVTLTVGAVATGTIVIGQAVTGTGVAPGTVITAGAGLSWTVNNTQTVASTSMTLSGTTAYWTPSANLVWTTLTSNGAFDSVLVYNNTAAGKNAVSVHTFGTQNVTAGVFTLTMPVNAAGTALLNFA